MNSSGIRNLAATNVLKQAESGGVRSQASAKGFNPVSSNSEVTAVSEGKGGAKKPSFLKALTGNGTRSQGREDGIHVLTIEERFESTLPTNMEPLPYSTGRGPRTPGDSRKTSEESNPGNYATTESLAMSAVSGRGTISPLAPALPTNHPYNRY